MKIFMVLMPLFTNYIVEAENRDEIVSDLVDKGYDLNKVSVIECKVHKISDLPKYGAHR